MPIYDNYPLKDVYYLATPFEHPLPHIPYWRFIAAAEVAAALASEGVPVFCPIMHSYPQNMVAKAAGYDLSRPFWIKHDLNYMRICQAGIAVVHLPGWERSEGVEDEIAWYAKKGLPQLNLRRSWLEGVLHPKTLKILDEAETLTKDQEK